MRTSFLVVVFSLVASAQPARRELADAVQALDAASIQARRAGGPCRESSYAKLADLADRLYALGAQPRLRPVAASLEQVSDLHATVSFNECPPPVVDGVGAALGSLEALRVALWNERKDERSGADANLAQLAPLVVKTNDVFEREPAVRVSVPELTLKGLRGQGFYLGARFRSLQGNWSEWVTTQQWAVPADPFVWKNPFTHVFRASRLAEEDFANGAFVARVAVFDAQGRELAFREKGFQAGQLPQLPQQPPTPARDCGTGQDVGCTLTRDGVLPVERAGFLGLVDALRAEKSEKKRGKTFEAATTAVYLTAAQFTALLDLFPSDGLRLDAAQAVARRVVNLGDAVAYGGRFKAPDARAQYASLLRSLLDPNAAPRAWRVEGEMDHTGFTFEAPTREAIGDKCRAWKNADIRLQGSIMRLAIKGGRVRTDMMRSDAACDAIRDAATPQY